MRRLLLCTESYELYGIGLSTWIHHLIQFLNDETSQIRENYLQSIPMKWLMIIKEILDTMEIGKK